MIPYYQVSRWARFRWWLSNKMPYAAERRRKMLSALHERAKRETEELWSRLAE